MRDPARVARICEKLERVWNLWGQDQRFGQLVENICRTHILPDHMWDTEDTLWEQWMDQILDAKGKKE